MPASLAQDSLLQPGGKDENILSWGVGVIIQMSSYSESESESDDYDS